MIRVMKPLEKAFFMAVAFALGLALALHFSGKSLTDVALGAKPPSPPGQGPCDHGNGDTNGNAGPCKEDPGPGKDCEEHGKKGGVNEDHCKGTDTTPTDTTPTETTPTETTPTTPEETTSTPTDTTPSTSTTPTPEETTSTPSSPEPTPVVPVVTPTELENQLDKQAKKNNPEGVPATSAGSLAAANELPYTGFSLAWAVALGLGLVALGGYLKGYRIVRTFKP